MGCGASSSAIDYAQIAPGGRRSMQLRGTEDAVVDFGLPQVLLNSCTLLCGLTNAILLT